MTTSLLLRTLRQLPARDLRALPQWVRCALINRREDVALLCEYLCSQIGKAGDAETRAGRFSAESLWTAACPGKPFDDKQLRHVMSFLLAAVRQYLAWDEWKEDELEMQLFQLRAFRRRRLDQQFVKSMESSETLFRESLLQDTQYHLNRYLYFQEKAAYDETATASTTVSLSDELTTFYIAALLRDACHTRSRHPAAKIEYRIDFHNVILKAAGRQDMLQLPAIAVYYHAFRMLDAPMEDEPMEQLKSSLKQHEKSFSPDEMRYLYQLVIHGCIRRMNAGRKLFAREAFELYQHALSLNILMENGRLPGDTYKSIVQVAAGLQEYEWAEKFIEEYKNELPPREREHQYRYNTGYLCFRQKKYNQALPLLKQIHFEDTPDSLDSRRILLQVYFALNRQADLASELNSFRQYLQKQKGIGPACASHENFAGYLARILEARVAGRQAILQLHDEIASRHDIAEKSWLLEQCA